MQTWSKIALLAAIGFGVLPMEAAATDIAPQTGDDELAVPPALAMAVAGLAGLVARRRSNA